MLIKCGVQKSLYCSYAPPRNNLITPQPGVSHALARNTSSVASWTRELARHLRPLLQAPLAARHEVPQYPSGVWQVKSGGMTGTGAT
ncbi:hypothetical protein EUA02_07890 [Mycobacterium paragordonae]|nr:hypothetical protein EUA02_07890 [Mycobacterium paragordonae]TDL09014.1 hypothetical protein EUA05_08410 [Mycobacterium paragordonae]